MNNIIYKVGLNQDKLVDFLNLVFSKKITIFEYLSEIDEYWMTALITIPDDPELFTFIKLSYSIAEFSTIDEYLK